MDRIYVSNGGRRLTFMLATSGPATQGERAALQLALPHPASDGHAPPRRPGPERPTGRES